MNDSQRLTIGSVAQRAGTSVTTVRYYDDIGLVRAAERVGGTRRFDEHAVHAVAFVKRAQQVGFTLDQIRGLLDADTDRTALIAERLADARAQRRRLDEMIDLLDRALLCRCDVVTECRQLAE